jgi:hypothetical protein
MNLIKFLKKILMMNTFKIKDIARVDIKENAKIKV